MHFFFYSNTRVEPKLLDCAKLVTTPLFSTMTTPRGDKKIISKRPSEMQQINAVTEKEIQQ